MGISHQFCASRFSQATVPSSHLVKFRSDSKGIVFNGGNKERTPKQSLFRYTATTTAEASVTVLCVQPTAIAEYRRTPVSPQARLPSRRLRLSLLRSPTGEVPNPISEFRNRSETTTQFRQALPTVPQTAVFLTGNTSLRQATLRIRSAQALNTALLLHYHRYSGSASTPRHFRLQIHQRPQDHSIVGFWCVLFAGVNT